jgi:hypothetical protein
MKIESRQFDSKIKFLKKLKEDSFSIKRNQKTVFIPTINEIDEKTDFKPRFS